MEKITELLKYVKNSDDDYLKIVSPSFMSKKLSTYMLIREDLLFVKKNAELLIFIKGEQEKNEHFEETLWYSLISLYGRCFTDSSHSKKPKLEANDLFNSFNDEFETHKKLIDIRHTFIAHRGDNDNELPIVYLKVPKKEVVKQNNTPFEIISTRYTTESVDFLKDIITLTDFLVTRVEEKIQKQSDKLYKGIMNLDPAILRQITLK
ncbi:hypothetical protein [Gelidibacter japonicus]|uniref:hypothetical protein n=1 Tax=Gelidibacter japonicus TaxID=1962232 RepID=UPI002AFE5CBA|nr:hypothetical protein [Gelidibacter japonicus]